MKIKGNDIVRIAECLLDKSQNARGIVSTTIYSFFDKSRHPHFPIYRHEENIHEMVKMGLLTIIKTEHHSKVVGLEIQRFPYFTVQFSPSKIKNWLLKKEKTIISPIKKKVDRVLSWKRLKINVTQGTLQYNNNKLLEVSFERKEIKLLVYLYEKEKVVPYSELAEVLDYTYQGNYDKVTNRSISQVKRDLQDILIEKCGMPKKEAKSLIISKRMVGYKLNRN